MAFCNNTTKCGHDCGRQDDHGGSCDCYSTDCSKSRFYVNPAWEKTPSEAGKNLKQPLQFVRHTELKRASDESAYRSLCPVCEEGILLIRRFSLQDPRLSKFDNCSLCAQTFFYEDDEINGEKLVSHIPLTLEETVEALDKMLSDDDRAFLQNSEDPEGAAVALHHTLGRVLRNTWALWAGSPLARHFREVHSLDHPDDMSGKILRNYTRARFPTRYQRIASDED